LAERTEPHVRDVHGIKPLPFAEPDRLDLPLGVVDADPYALTRLTQTNRSNTTMSTVPASDGGCCECERQFQWILTSCRPHSLAASTSFPM
jgi:hypothetical protein